MTRCRIALLLPFLLLEVPTAQATPLDKAACDKLKSEQLELEQGGVRAAMANGPQWAKANLKPEQLDQVRRILDIEGQLQFRCNGHPLVALPKDVDADPALSDAGEPIKEAAPAGEPREGAPPGGAAPAGGQKAAGNKGVVGRPARTAGHATAPASGEQTGKAKAKPKAKARADDAYKPPPSDPTADPFATR
jgi:hypothetical protein